MHSFFESNLHIAQYVPFGLIIAIIIFTAIGWSVGLYRLKKYGESGAVIRDSLYTLLIGISIYVILSLELPNLLMPYEEVNRDLLILKDAVK